MTSVVTRDEPWTAKAKNLTVAPPGSGTADYQLKVIDAEVTLDETSSPYVTAQLTVVLPPEYYAEQIDPRTLTRVQIDASKSWVSPVRDPQSRSFNLLVHERIADPAGATLRLTLTSDEAFLIDRALVASAPERTYGLSMRTAVSYALAKVGATLEAGSVDVNLATDPLKPVLTNYVQNPSMETNATNWAATAGSSAAARSTTYGWQGSASIRWTASSSSTTSNVQYGGTTALPVTEGNTYTFSAYIRSSLAQPVYLKIRWSGVSATLDTDGVSITSSTSGWTRYSATGRAPVGATGATIFAVAVTNTAGQFHYIDGVMFHEGSEPVEYFDGSTLGTRDPNLYSVAWTGTAQASTSTLTNLPHADATILYPGTKYVDYVAPLLTATNRRLFCDEARKWRLVDGSSYTLPGVVNVSSGFNVITADDSIDLADAWFDSVVVIWEWNDSAGVTQTVYEAAGAPGTVTRTINYDRPYPGPGAAAAILTRGAGRGRVQSLDALTDLTATPGMAIVSTLPGWPIQTGIVSSVTFRWSAEGDSSNTMTVRTRGLTNTPVGAYALAPPTRSYAASTGSYATYVN